MSEPTLTERSTVESRTSTSKSSTRNQDKYFGITKVIEASYPDTCFTVTRDIDDAVVVYTHTRVGDSLSSTVIVPRETSLSNLKTMKEMTNILYRNMFTVPKGCCKQIKRGRYEVSVATFPDKKITLSLLKNGNVKTLTNIGTHESVRLRNIHLSVVTNGLNMPIGVKKADIYGITEDGVKVHEEIVVTAEMEAAVRGFLY